MFISPKHLAVVAASLLATLAVASAHVSWQALNEPGCGGAIVSISVSPHDSHRLLVAGDMLGMGFSTDRGDHWTWVKGLKVWEMADTTWSPTEPSVVWVGTMAGPYVSTDGGQTWTEKRQGMSPVSSGSYSLPIEKVLFDPNQPGRLLAFGGTSRRWNESGARGVIWESFDRGDSWHKLTCLTPSGADPVQERGLNIVAAAYLGKSGDKLLCLADGGGVFVSNDDGRSWTKANAGLPQKGFDVGRLAVHPDDENIAYVGVSWGRDEQGHHAPGGIYKTVDGGRSWSEKSGGLAKLVSDPKNHNLISNYGAVAVARSNPDVMYTCDASWSQGIIYKSTDGGESWAPNCTRGQLGQKSNTFVGKIANVETATFAGLCMGYMAIAPTDENAVYAVNSECIARTLDGGRSWDDATAYRPEPEKTELWRGRGYSGWCSTDFVFNPGNPADSILLAMDAGKGWRSRNGLKSWKYLGNEPWAWGGATAAVYAGDVIYMTAGQFGDNLGIHKFMPDDRQIVFTGAKHGLPDLHQGGQPAGIYALPDNPDKVWATIGGTLYRSIDGGDQWKRVADGKGLQSIAGDPTKPERLYISGEDGVYTCHDGQTLENIGGPRPATRGRLRVDAQGRVYVALWRQEHGGLWRYANATWTRLLDDAHVFDIANDPLDPARIAVATNDDPYHDYTNASGVWTSVDDGESWSQANDGLPMLRVQCIRFNPHNSEQLVAGTFGSGFVLGTWPKGTKDEGTKRYEMTSADAQFAAAPSGVARGGGTATASAPSSARELLRNGNMETGDALPQGWDGHYGDDKVKAYRDTDVKKGGIASVRVEPNGGSGQVFQMVENASAKRIRITGSFKVGGKAKAQVYVQSFDEGFKSNKFQQIIYQQGSSRWRPFDKELELPPAHVRFAVGVLAEGEGQAWIDDVSVMETGSTSASASAPAPAQTKPHTAAASEPSISTIIRDFGPQGVDYTYDGTSWAKQGAIAIGSADGAGYIQIDATEHGGAGVILNGISLAGHGEKYLAIRARLLPGNQAGMLHLNINRDGAPQLGYDVPLRKFNKEAFTTVTIPLGDQDLSRVAQVQLQGTNFSPGAGPLKIQIDRIGTSTGEATLPDSANNEQPSGPGSGPAAKDKPAVLGWGYWPQFPQAWMQTHEGFVNRAKSGNIDVAFFGDSLTQGWGNDSKSKFVQYFGPRAANFGIGGDSTRQVLWRILNGEADGYNAKLFVVRIGTNNLYEDNNSGTDEEIADGITAVVLALRQKQPQAKVLLLGLLPRQNGYFCTRIDKINATIRKLDDGNTVRYLDMGDRFEASHGDVKPELYVKDQLHLSVAGYDLNYELMKPLYSQMRGAVEQ